MNRWTPERRTPVRRVLNRGQESRGLETSETAAPLRVNPLVAPGLWGTFPGLTPCDQIIPYAMKNAPRLIPCFSANIHLGGILSM